MLHRTLKMAFWVFYDHLGKLLLANLISVVIMASPLVVAHILLIRWATGHVSQVLSLGIALLASCLGVPLAFAGLYALVRELIDTRDGTLATYFSGMRRYGIKMVALSVLYMFVSACLVSSIIFYATHPPFNSPFVGYSISALALWIQLFLLVSLVFAGPAAIYKSQGILTIIKFAIVLALDNPLFALNLVGILALLALVGLLPPILVFFLFTWLAVVQCSAYELLSRKYNAIQAALQAGTYDKKNVQIDFGDENDEYLCRNFRDFLFPWKG